MPDLGIEREAEIRVWIRESLNKRVLLLELRLGLERAEITQRAEETEVEEGVPRGGGAKEGVAEEGLRRHAMVAVVRAADEATRGGGGEGKKIGDGF